MKTGIYRQLFRYVSFNVLGMVGISCYILADTFFIANGVGSDGLTALNLVLPLYSLMYGGGMLLGMGGATRYSIYRGQGNPHKGNSVFTRILVLGICFGFIYMATGLIFSNQLISALGSDSATHSLAHEYITTIFMFAPAFVVNSILNCFIRNDNNPNLSMIAMVTGSLSNIVLDYVFIFPFEMGMFGAALATCMSPIISILIMSSHWIRKKASLKLVKCKIFVKSLPKTLSLGINSFLTEISNGVIVMVFNFVILALSGNAGVAAYGVVANIAIVAMSIFSGLSQGGQPLLSQNFGQNNTVNIKKILKTLSATAIVLGVTCYLVCFIFSEQIVGAFNRDNDPGLQLMAVKGLKVYFLALPIMGLNIVFSSFFASIAKGGASFLIAILRGIVAVIPSVIILGFSPLGMSGVWLSIPCAETITLIIAVICIIVTRRKNFGIKEKNPDPAKAHA